MEEENNSTFLIGRWVKIKDENEYYKIKDIKQNGYAWLEKSTDNYIDLHYANKPNIIKSSYELMPVEFNLEQVNNNYAIY